MAERAAAKEPFNDIFEGATDQAAQLARERAVAPMTPSATGPLAPATRNGLAAGQAVVSYFFGGNPTTTGLGAPARY